MGWGFRLWVKRVKKLNIERRTLNEGPGSREGREGEKGIGKSGAARRSPKPGGYSGGPVSRDSVLECGSPLPLCGAKSSTNANARAVRAWLQPEGCVPIPML